MRRTVFALTCGLASLAGHASAQPIELGADPFAPFEPRTSLVGHSDVVDVATDGEHAWTLGGDGLLIAWQGNPISPRAWTVFEGARFVLAHDRDAIVASTSEVVRVNGDTLEVQERWPADGVVDCAGTERAWSWSDRDGIIRLHGLQDVAVISGGAVPNTTAVCSVGQGSTYLAWFAGDSAAVLAFDGASWTRSNVPWPWAMDPRVVPEPSGPRIYAIDDDGVPVVVDVRTGVALTSSTPPPPSWRACAAFDSAGQVARCSTTSDRLTRAALVPASVVAMDALAVADTVTLVEPHGWIHVTASAPPTVTRAASPTLRVYGVVGIDAPTVLACLNDGDGAHFEAIDPNTGEARATQPWDGSCPEAAWVDATAAAWAGPTNALLWRRDGFELQATEHVVSLTPGFGRSDLGLAVVNEFDGACGSMAASLWRTERGARAELLFGPLCGETMRLVPMDDGAGGASGAALLLEQEDATRVFATAFDTDVVELGVLPLRGDGIVRVATTDDGIELDDARAGQTWQLGPNGLRGTALVARRGLRSVTSDGQRVWVRGEASLVALVFDGGALAWETSSAFGATGTLARRQVVRGLDGTAQIAAQIVTAGPTGGLREALIAPDVRRTGMLPPRRAPDAAE